MQKYKILWNFQTKNLKILNYNENKICDINIFEKANFKELEILDLNANKILDIKILEKVNFKELEVLNSKNN